MGEAGAQRAFDDSVRAELIHDTLRIARDYLADRRVPLPRPHELAVALVEIADALDRARAP
jgi:hypothetical protein